MVVILTPIVLMVVGIPGFTYVFHQFDSNVGINGKYIPYMEHMGYVEKWFANSE